MWPHEVESCLISWNRGMEPSLTSQTLSPLLLLCTNTYLQEIEKGGRKKEEPEEKGSGENRQTLSPLTIIAHTHSRKEE